MRLNALSPSLSILFAKSLKPNGILVDGKILDEISMLDSFLFYLIAYDDVHTCFGNVFFRGRNPFETKEEPKDKLSILAISLHFSDRLVSPHLAAFLDGSLLGSVVIRPSIEWESLERLLLIIVLKRWLRVLLISLEDFFRSLSDQIYRSTEHHKFVREHIVKQLKIHRELYEGYVPMVYDEYLKKMSKAGEWGDHVTLQAAADSVLSGGTMDGVVEGILDSLKVGAAPESVTHDPKVGDFAVEAIGRDMCLLARLEDTHYISL
ncbi:hypothetical protein CQW23_28471 [Capsicum baccatum]|uniref:OTU domain-containing protein n=1 Tax=Capsicum baccatum TaxID=33114 RepID=A0A2G2VGM4_CAPBA|nr:hypothetical protein CQW23_28471 [Capsicum baccatum]